MLRIHSPLPDDLESLITEVIGLCINVHKELGPGLNERVYGRACRVELEARELKISGSCPQSHISQTATYLRLTGAPRQVSS
jgi:hypothetical protein